MSEQTDMIEVVARGLCEQAIINGYTLPGRAAELAEFRAIEVDNLWPDYVPKAQQAIAIVTKALVDGAGEIKRLLRWWGVDGVAGDRRMLVEAATTIAALGAENERLRVALHDAIRRPMGVVPASADEFYSPAEADAAEQRRIARSAALSDLIAGDADLIDAPATKADSDGDDGA